MTSAMIMVDTIMAGTIRSLHFISLVRLLLWSCCWKAAYTQHSPRVTRTSSFAPQVNQYT